MADASSVNAVSGLRGDPLFSQVQSSLNKLRGDVGLLRTFMLNRLATVSGTYSLTTNITDGGTSGKAKLLNTISYLIGGTEFKKVTTDDLWDLTGLSYNASLYTGVLFLLSSAGTASITSATSTTAAKAVQSVLVLHTDTTKAAVHCYVANSAVTFANSALTAMGSFNQNLTPDLQSFVVNWG